MLGSEVHKRVLHALADSVTDNDDFAFTGVDIRQGWGGILTVTIHGETDDGVPGAVGRALLESVESAIGPERHQVRLETARRH